MKNLMIALVVALACYTLANLVNGRVEAVSIAPMTAAIFSGIGAYSAMVLSHGFGK